MREALFPVLGPLLTLGLVLPLSALVAKIVLSFLDRWRGGAALHAGNSVRFALLVGSSTLPVAWFVSAALHQSEPGLRSSACSLAHEPDAYCPEPGGFVLVVIVILAARLFAHVAPWRTRMQEDLSTAAMRARERVSEVVQKHPHLAALARRVHVVRADEPVATRGWLAPRIEVRADFVDRLDDDALAAALSHELAHVRGRDPLRYDLLSWAMAINPFARVILGRELSRWVLAREAHCDRAAVADGGSALALADALVCAARPSPSALRVALGPVGSDSLRLRVSLLLSYASAPPAVCCRENGVRLLVVPLLLAVVLPHLASTAPLDVVHAWSELLGLLVLGG